MWFSCFNWPACLVVARWLLSTEIYYPNKQAILSYSEKGICMSTVSLWILLVYTEASLRLKDQKNAHANLSHIFAAHWYVGDCLDLIHTFHVRP